MNKEFNTQMVGVNGKVGSFYTLRTCEECHHEWQTDATQLQSDEGDDLAMYTDCPDCQNEHVVYIHDVIN